MVGSALDEALALAERVGLVLDPWQQGVLDQWLAEDLDGRWAAFEATVVVPRQNGKGAILEARELAGLFLFGEKTIIHSAHETKTSKEAFRRMEAYIRSDPVLFDRVGEDGFKRSNEEVSITVRDTKARIRYLTRSTSGGRGFTADLLVLDEAYNLPAEVMAAIIPVLSARPNAQIVYASSAGMAQSHALWSLRQRALAGGDPSLAYAEWTAEGPRLSKSGEVEVSPVDPDDEGAWLASNPSIGVQRPDGSGLSLSAVANERRAMAGSPDQFLRERLGVWEPIPDEDKVKEPKLTEDQWMGSVTDRTPALKAGELTLAFDVNVDGAWSAVVACYGTPTEPFVDLIEHNPGMGWLAPRVAELVRDWRPVKLVCNAVGPSAAQIGPVMVALSELKLDRDVLKPVSAIEYKRGCQGLVDDLDNGRLSRPVGQSPLDQAGLGAVERRVGDSWVWDGHQVDSPICSLVAATMARQEYVTQDEQVRPNVAGSVDSEREQQILDQIAEEEERALEALNAG